MRAQAARQDGRHDEMGLESEKIFRAGMESGISRAGAEHGLCLHGGGVEEWQPG